MRPFHLGDHAFINLENIASWDFTKTEISTELSRGDIFDIRLVIYTTDTNEFTIDEPEMIMQFLHALGGRDGSLVYGGENSIEYYVRKSNDYYIAKRKNEAEAERE